jgi:hypothetical protein
VGGQGHFFDDFGEQVEVDGINGKAFTSNRGGNLNCGRRSKVSG